MGGRLKAGDQAPNFQLDSPWSGPRDFYAETEGRSAVLVFLRYLGCPISRLEGDALKREVGLLTGKGARVFVFLQSAPDTLAQTLTPDAWPFEIAADPAGRIYRLYAVEAGGVLAYLRPRGLLAAARAMASGYRHGRFEGRETQLPAAFVIDAARKIRFAHYGRHIGDVPRPARLARELE